MIEPPDTPHQPMPTLQTKTCTKCMGSGRTGLFARKCGPCNGTGTRTTRTTIETR